MMQFFSPAHMKIECYFSSGPGGLTQIGPIGPWGRGNAGEVSLHGTNTYTGPTTVSKGTRSLANACSPGDQTDVSISDGGTLDLNFKREMRFRQLVLDGTLQPGGSSSAANTPQFIKGTGILKSI